MLSSGLSFVIAGLLILAIGPLFEKRFGSNYLTGTLIAGFVLELLGLVIGILAFSTTPGKIAVIAAGVIIVWSLIMYARYRLSAARAAAEMRKRASTPPSSPSLATPLDTGDNPSNPDQRERSECRPRLQVGRSQLASSGGKYDSWRADLRFVFSTSPTNNRLTLSNWSAGGAYYGLWTRSGEVDIDTRVDVECFGDCDNCRINGSIVGPIEGIDGIVRGYTAINLQTSGDTLTASVTMGAALSATGGPSINIGAKPGGVGADITLAWPDSTFAATNGMGSYVWKCQCP